MADFKVAYHQVDQASADIQSGSADIARILEEMDSELRQIEWEGEAFLAYEDAKRKWTDGMRGLQDVLHRVGGRVGRAVGDYKGTDQHVANSFA